MQGPGIVQWIEFIAWWIFSFLFFTIWGWAILLLVFVPLLGRLLRTGSRRRRFRAARHAELANPHNADARFQLGVIHYEGRQKRRALRYFQEAVRISEAHGSEVDPKLYQYLGHTLRRLRHCREAIVAYEAGLEEAPESGRGESENGIAVCQQKLGDLEAAEHWYRQSVDRNRSLLEPRVRLAALLLDKGERADAQALLADAREGRLPAFAKKQERRWRVALALFPLARLVL